MPSDGRAERKVRLPRELDERLAAAASERLVGVNLLVTRAIEEYLKRLVPLDQIVKDSDG